MFQENDALFFSNENDPKGIPFGIPRATNTRCFDKLIVSFDECFFTHFCGMHNEKLLISTNFLSLYSFFFFSL